MVMSTPASDLQPKAGESEVATLQLLAEELSVSKRRLASQLVRVATKTNTRDVLVDEPLRQENVVIERVAVGSVVEAIPAVRQEGDVTIIPVVEEEVVVTRRLILREEVHIRRVSVETAHVETVTLREQQVVVTREPVEPSAADQVPVDGAAEALHPLRSTLMESETIVAVYDTAAHADAAIADLRSANVPESSISRHTGTPGGATSAPPVREQGFWSSLFGGSADHDESVYDRSLDTGSSVVIVKGTPSHDIDAVMAILERHSPIDIDERASGYGLTSGTASSGMTSGATTGAATTSVTGTGAGLSSSASTGTMAGGLATTADQSGMIQLSEEQLAVGKRLINRGGTRVRRYVVETPVEESVSLHSEKVTLERHPVAAGVPVTDGSFSEKVIEMTETAEEAVVSKTARVVEEVGLRKEATDRVETIRDTVRKEEVEIEQIPGSGTASTGTTTTGTTLDPRTPKI